MVIYDALRKGVVAPYFLVYSGNRGSFTVFLVFCSFPDMYINLYWDRKGLFIFYV